MKNPLCLRLMLVMPWLFCAFGDIIAQPFFQPLQSDFRIQTEAANLQAGISYHPVWPAETSFNDSLVYKDLRAGTGGRPESWLRKKLFRESLLLVDTAGFRLKADFLMDFGAGPESGNKGTAWTNTRGFRADGSIGHRFAFHTAFYENQSVLPSWLDSTVRYTEVVPGQGYAKPFKGQGYDYAFAEGHLAWAPSRYFTLMFGQGRQFIGEGYRSLMLSDAAHNYPFLSVRTKVWHLEYVNLFTQMQHMEMPYTGVNRWEKKYTAMHYLSYNILPWLNVGLFEAIIFPAQDDNGRLGFEIAYLNPVIFYRPVEYEAGSSHNALLGASLRVIIRQKYVVYSQLMLDEFKLEYMLDRNGWWANKNGLQAGVKTYDFAGFKNLFVQLEYNQVRPYTFSHKKEIQNYGHFNQPIGHPQGANFREVLFRSFYRYQRLLVDLKLVTVVYGADTANLNLGKNIFLPYNTYVSEFGNKIGQGLRTRLTDVELRGGWLVNPETNLQVSLGINVRFQRNDLTDTRSSLLWIGIRSALFNKYYDW